MPTQISKLPPSPTRLPPAPVAPVGSRRSTPRSNSNSSSPRSTTPTITTLVPLSPLKSPSLPSDKKSKMVSKDSMPPASAVLIASRSPHPTSPRAVASDTCSPLEAFALRVHRQRQHESGPRKPSAVVSVMVTKPKKRRLTTIIPKLANNNNFPNNNNANDQRQQNQQNQRHQYRKANKAKKRGRKDDGYDDAGDGGRHLNAGVYVLENVTTGHRFFSTTWDLANAHAQNLADLRDGVHPHQALVKSYQCDPTNSNNTIRFRILERVTPPANVNANKPTKPKPTPTKPTPTKPTPTRRGHQHLDPGFDVHTMEQLLQNRLLFHTNQLIRKYALRLVQRRLVLPILAHFWPKWKQNALYSQQNQERLAAAVVVQSIARVWHARRLVKRLRQHRAACRITTFLSLCAMKRVLWQRRQLQRIHDAATTIQRLVTHFVVRKRHERRVTAVTNWLQARRIQRVYRGHAARTRVLTIRWRQRQQKAALEIQRIIRGFLARQQISARAWHTYLNTCATSIQCRWRGVYARQYLVAPRQERAIQQHAARCLQRFLRGAIARHKLTHAATQFTQQTQYATRIHVAYKNYVAKKFGWAAMTFQLEHSSATRIQRAISRWFFFKRLRQLVAAHKLDGAARAIQRVFRGVCGRKRALKQRDFRTKDRAIRRIQRTWRLCHGLHKLQQAWRHWTREKSACVIQTAYRASHARRTYAVARWHARRHCAATRIQSKFRANRAKQMWRQRLQWHRDGVACQDCGNHQATMFSWTLGLEVCDDCLVLYQSLAKDGAMADTVVPVALHRCQQRLARHTQRVYRGFQARMACRHGMCSFCDRRAIRKICRGCSRSACHTCDALFHKPLGLAHQKKPHERLRIERAMAQDHAVVVIQKHLRRFFQRHTIARLQHEAQAMAAAKIQRYYVARRTRRQTHLIAMSHHQRMAREYQATLTIQRVARGFLARRLRAKLAQRKSSAIQIQRVFRGHRGRGDAMAARQRRDACVFIQRHVRGIQGRRVACARRLEFELATQQRSAVVIQCHARGWRVRKTMWHEKRMRAATKIQCLWRCHVAQQKLANLWRERHLQQQLAQQAMEDALRLIQQEKEHGAAVKIQCMARKCHARHEKKTRQLARATRWRLEQFTKWHEMEHKSAICLQQFVRRQWLTRASQASLAVQRMARMWLARRTLCQLRATKRAAVAIQRAFRYSRVKRKLTRLVAQESVAAAGTLGGTGWVELFDDESGCVYYYHRETMASSWVKPPELMGHAPAAAAVAAVEGTWEEQGYDGYDGYGYPTEEYGVVAEDVPEWVEYWDENVGASYYYNTTTGEATWATPTTDGEGVASLGDSNQHDGGGGGAAWPPGAPVDVDGKDKEKKAWAPAGGSTAETVNNQVESGDPVDRNQGDGGGGGGGAHQQRRSSQDGFDESLVDTSYNLHYEIFLTQQQQQQQQQQQPEPDS